MFFFNTLRLDTVLHSIYPKSNEDLIVGEPMYQENIRKQVIREQLSQVLESSVFAQSEWQRTVHEERTRIARELHDTFHQTFLTALMQLGVAVDSLPSDSPVRPRLDRIRRLMDQGIEEGRNTVQGLRSPDSRAVDLVTAFSQVRQEIGIQAEIDFRVVVIGQKQPLRSRIANEVYRIGREALVNAFRHSGAKRVELELEYSDAGLCMRVRDDGCGIDPRVLQSGREGHWGLTGMRERAARIGARLKVSGSASYGTEVQLSVPHALAF